MSSISRSDLTTSQKCGDDCFHEWYANKGFRKQPILRIGGAAGTGKSFFLEYIKQKYKFRPENVLFVAYTGQAVNVLRQRGIPANTIHSKFLQLVEEPLKDKRGVTIKRGGIPLTTFRFVPVDHISSKVKIVIVDEASFLPEDLEATMRRYGLPIFETGDPIQLPPVTGKQCFNMDTMDVIFTEVMRHALDSEILDLATRLREGVRIDTSSYSNEVRFIKSSGDIERDFFRYKPFFAHSDSIITTTNRQRTIITELYRKEILDTTSEYPIAGEKLICRKNNRNMLCGDYPLMNGTVGTCMYNIPRSQIDRKTDTYYMDFMPNFLSNDYFDNIMCDHGFLTGPFGSDKMVDKWNKGNKFEFAHAITTHLAQGAQYDSALFMDQPVGSDEYMMRLRYTAVTRAKQKLYYLLSTRRGIS